MVIGQQNSHSSYWCQTWRWDDKELYGRTAGPPSLTDQVSPLEPVLRSGDASHHRHC